MLLLLPMPPLLLPLSASIVTTRMQLRSRPVRQPQVRQIVEALPRNHCGSPRLCLWAATRGATEA
eukprot:4644804-Lingulodinium_polyedra.AAC.1